MDRTQKLQQRNMSFLEKLEIPKHCHSKVRRDFIKKNSEKCLLSCYITTHYYIMNNESLTSDAKSPKQVPSAMLKNESHYL
jgi:hypothetical protein